MMDEGVTLKSKDYIFIPHPSSLSLFSIRFVNSSDRGREPERR